MVPMTSVTVAFKALNTASLSITLFLSYCES
uniref:Uncharacterized protein n=1 Tax=Magnetococcus massalia (strain MO-1) TaxID=451514 RepID=A0A1S7LMU3_MAGMO|nr:protein of unknown function [Candidatus Magnetococcus massalia]